MSDLATEIEALATLSSAQLREAWTKLVGGPPPRVRQGVFALLAEAIEREPKDANLVIGQMIDHDSWNRRELDRNGCIDERVAVDDPLVAVDRDGDDNTELHERRPELRFLRGRVLPRRSHVTNELLRGIVDDRAKFATHDMLG